MPKIPASPIALRRARGISSLSSTSFSCGESASSTNLRTEVCKSLMSSGRSRSMLGRLPAWHGCCSHSTYGNTTRRTPHGARGAGRTRRDPARRACGDDAVCGERQRGWDAGAEANQPLVAALYGITEPLVRPFQGIFPEPAGPAILDIAALLAIVFLFLIGALVVALV